MATLLPLAPPVPLTKTYPHLDAIADWPTNQTLRLLWDRVWDLESRLQAAETNLKNASTALDTLNAQLQVTTKNAKQAIALAQQP